MTQAELTCDGPLRAAVLYLPESPTVATVDLALERGALLARSALDHEPTPPGGKGGLVFGRVAGVVAASTYVGKLTNDREHRAFLTVPGTRSFLWDAKLGAAGERDAAPLLRRNDHSAYRSWGNYGGEFRIAARLENPTDHRATVRVFLDSPGPAAEARAFRGEIEVRAGGEVHRVVASERAGARGDRPIATITLEPGEERELSLRTFYAANDLPPQVIRLETTRAPWTSAQALISLRLE